MGSALKIKVLKHIAKALNQAQITWSLGASMLLYFKGVTADFHDIDLMVLEKDVEKVKGIMGELGGVLQPINPSDQYRTKAFLEYKLWGVEIDIMAGFIIVFNDKVYDCSLTPDQIEEYLDLEGEQIPLQSLDLWRTYYGLMGREDKVQLIQNTKRPF